MRAIGQWHKYKQQLGMLELHASTQSDKVDKESISYTPLSMKAVPKSVLCQLKPHYSDYTRVAVHDARYWHTGTDLHGERQLFLIVRNSPIRVKAPRQCANANTYAFVKNSVLATYSEPTYQVSGAANSPSALSNTDYGKLSRLKRHAGRGRQPNQPPSLTIAPAIIIDQPNKNQRVRLQESRLTKRRFASHTLGPGETAQSVVELYTGTQDTHLIYDFNYPTFTKNKRPQVGDTVRICTGFDVLLKGMFYNSDAVQLIWRGPTSGSQSAKLETVMGEYVTDKGYEWELALPLIAGDYTLTAESAGATHSVSFTVAEPSEQQQIIGFFYLPDEQCFIAVTPALAAILDQEMAILNAPVKQLKQSVKGEQSNAQQLATAKQALNATLKPLVKGPNANSITEIVGYKGRKYTYVRSDKIANHVRSYRLDTDIRNGHRFSDKDGRLNKSKLKEALKNDVSKLKTSFKFDKKLIDTYTAVWGDWAQELNKDLSIKGFEKNDYFDASAEAQLMRYTHGSSVAATFNPTDGVFALQGDFQVDFAVGEAKAAMSGYFPNKTGYELTFSMPLKNSTEEKIINIGAVRLAASISAFGYAGAKLQGSVNLGCTVNQGKLMIDGLNYTEQQAMQQKDTTFQPVKAEVNAFVGASAGCEATGAIQWDNPEKAGKSSFCDLAKLGSNIKGSLGVGAEAGFYIGYDAGKFILRAKAGLVWGVGVGGELVCEVGVDEIVTLAQFVYHQLKNNDYDYLAFIQPLAFKVLYKAVGMHIATGQVIADFIGKTTVQIDSWWQNKVLIHDRVEDIAQRIQKVPDMLKFTVPEAKGAMLHLLANPNLASLADLDSYTWSGLNEQRESAIITILKHVLCTEELDEVLQHMGRGGANCTREAGLAQLNSILDGTQQREFDAWQRTLPTRARSGSVAVAMIDAAPFTALA